MRRSLSLLVGICMAIPILVPLSASAANIPPQGLALPTTDSDIIHAQYGRDDRGWRGERSRRYCERLRRACYFKNERGEGGEGNCRRYRTECGRR